MTATPTDRIGRVGADQISHTKSAPAALLSPGMTPALLWRDQVFSNLFGGRQRGGDLTRTASDGVDPFGESLPAAFDESVAIPVSRSAGW